MCAYEPRPQPPLPPTHTPLWNPFSPPHTHLRGTPSPPTHSPTPTSSYVPVPPSHAQFLKRTSLNCIVPFERLQGVWSRCRGFHGVQGCGLVVHKLQGCGLVVQGYRGVVLWCRATGVWSCGAGLQGCGLVVQGYRGVAAMRDCSLG